MCINNSPDFVLIKFLQILKECDKNRSASQKYTVFDERDANEGDSSKVRTRLIRRSRNRTRSRCFQENVLVISIVPINFLRIDTAQ